tara:strand:- start:68 stop:772 length:705 start_codon:yes stop_codon:yes gene_type:complete
LSNTIKFASVLEGFVPPPKSASFFIPNDYKKMSPNNVSRNPMDAKTVKKCIPFLDALCVGYIIPFPIDILVRYDKYKKRMYWEYKEGIPKEYEHIVNIFTHSDGQVYESLAPRDATWKHVLKFHQPWTIKTPPGYSCIFTTPFNNRRPYKLIDGIVDTDTYPLFINCPFYWTADLKEEVLLKKGDPLVQVIPYKREEWVQEVESEDYDKRHFVKLHSKIDDSYKNQWWKKKSFK